MSELQEAIDELSHPCKKLPRNALSVVAEHREEALPILRNAIQKAITDETEQEEVYNLFFYAFCLLGQFQDRDSFPKLVELASLPKEKVFDLLGDAQTELLQDVLYNTYNGDLELLKSAVMNESADEFSRSAFIDVMGQLYLDGRLDEKEFKDFLRNGVHCGQPACYFYDALGGAICKCHFVDMLPEIRYMLDSDLMDAMVLGEYDGCVDWAFDYSDSTGNFCDSPIRTAERLSGWAMYEEDDRPSRTLDSEEQQKSFKKILEEEMAEQLGAQTGAVKVGRNEPCPCGSGKKYKFCCMNKPPSPLDAIESAGERKRCLKRYPYTGRDRQEGRVYLDDYYDAESIEIDTLLYLALANREELIFTRNFELENVRSRSYLILAFQKFMDRVKKEDIHTFAEYDKKYSIHYLCSEWMGRLLTLLEDEKGRELYKTVKSAYSEMNR